MRRDLLATLGLGMTFGLLIHAATPLMGSSYPDVDDSDPAAGAIERMRDAGIMVGDESGDFRPGDTVTRAELAIILDRLVNGTPVDDPDTNEECADEPECIPPDEYCFYGLVERDDNGCVVDCGPLACEGNAAPTECENQMECIPDEGCSFDEQERDENGCVVDCGPMLCNAVQCDDAVSCNDAPDGCWYAEEPVRDDNGCVMDCGALVCDEPNDDGDSNASSSENSDDASSDDDDWFEPIACENAPNCDDIPEGCRYEGDAEYDDSGCQASCGNLLCDDREPTDAACNDEPDCGDAPDGCWYEGEEEHDENGCRTSCGDLVCDEPME